MREILFRRKRKDNGEWINGCLLNFPENTYIIPHNSRCRYNTAEKPAVTVAPETVGQFTGLTDKNGTRIFEGDIVKLHTCQGTRIYTVDWCSDCAMFVLPCITNEEREVDFSIYFGEDFEIIGNVYDNPEFLKESEDTQSDRPEWKATMLKKWTETR